MQPISIKQAQSLLGGVSRPTIYNWIKKGLIKKYSVPGTRRTFLNYTECLEVFQGSTPITTPWNMIHHALYKKSCSTNSGYIPVRSTDCELFKSPLYLTKAFGYRKAIQAKVIYTISKGGKHLSSLFQTKPGPFYYGDTGDHALLFMIDGLQMEIFLFEGQRHLNEGLYLGVEKLPLDEVRRKARPVNTHKYARQLNCYGEGGQLEILKSGWK